MTVKETAVTITRGLHYHSDNSRSKETIGTIRSNTNRGLLRSFNGALKDYNKLLFPLGKDEVSTLKQV